MKLLWYLIELLAKHTLSVPLQHYPTYHFPLPLQQTCLLWPLPVSVIWQNGWSFWHTTVHAVLVIICWNKHSFFVCCQSLGNCQFIIYNCPWGYMYMQTYLIIFTVHVHVWFWRGNDVIIKRSMCLSHRYELVLTGFMGMIVDSYIIGRS